MQLVICIEIIFTHRDNILIEKIFSIKPILVIYSCQLVLFHNFFHEPWFNSAGKQLFCIVTVKYLTLAISIISLKNPIYWRQSETTIPSIWVKRFNHRTHWSSDRCILPLQLDCNILYYNIIYYHNTSNLMSSCSLRPLQRRVSNTM